MSNTAMKVESVPIAWHPGLSIFASEEFLKSVGDEYGWLGGSGPDGKLRCILPYTVVRKPVLRMARFRVETIPVNGSLTVDEERAFLNQVVEYLRSKGVDLIIPATTNTIFRTHPDGAVAAPYGTYVINLEQPEDVLFSGLNSSHRRKVRNAMKDGVEIRSGKEHMDVAYDLVRDTFARSKLPFMKRPAFANMIRALGSNVKIFVAVYREAIQGCAVVPFSNHSAYYVYGGSILEPANGAMHLLQWEAMRTARNLGAKRYDFVGARINPEKGSKQEGIGTFKERFGADLVQGYMWKFSITRLKYLIYSLAVRVRNRGDIVDQEKHKLPTGSEHGKQYERENISSTVSDRAATGT